MWKIVISKVSDFGLEKWRYHVNLIRNWIRFNVEQEELELYKTRILKAKCFI